MSLPEKEDFVMTDEIHHDHHKFLDSIARELHDFLVERREAREKWAGVKSTALYTLVGLITTGAVGFFVWLGKLVYVWLVQHPPEP